MDGPGVRCRPGHGRDSRPHNEERCLLVRPVNLRGACSPFLPLTRELIFACAALARSPPSGSRCSTYAQTSPSCYSCRADGSRRGQRPSTATAYRCPTRSGSSLSTAGRAHRTSDPICLQLCTGCSFSKTSKKTKRICFQYGNE
jgi:hypothetical protein